MPRTAPKDESGEVIHATSSFRPQVVTDAINEVEALEIEIADIMAKAVKKCQPKRDAIKAAIKQAAENGTPKREFRTILKVRRKMREALESVRHLDDEQKENVINMLKIPGVQLEMDFAAAA